jgi:hypothetical protein
MTVLFMAIETQGKLFRSKEITMDTLNQTVVTRNDWGAIRESCTPEFVKKLIEELDGEAYELGIESDRKQRGSAVNVALYAYDELQELAVIQVRQCIFHPRRFNQVKKDYFLIGRVENGEPFAHPCDVRAAGKMTSDDPTAGIRMALCKIWGVKERELSGIIRNGDVAFIPVKKLPEDAREITENMVTIRETHHVRALKGGQLWATGNTYIVPMEPKTVSYGTGAGKPYSFVDKLAMMGEEERSEAAKNRGFIQIGEREYFSPVEYYVTGPASIRHSEGEHPTVRASGKNKVWRVAAGKRVLKHGFARPTAD